MIERIDKNTGEIILYTQDEFICKRDVLMQLWHDAKAALDAAKETEMTLRKKFVDFVGDPGKQEGTETVDVGDGMEAKMVKKLTYGFIHTEDGRLNKKAIDKALSAIEDLLPEDGEAFVEQLVKWNPTLSISEYRKLDGSIKQIIDTVVTTKEAAPTLEIKEAKASKPTAKKRSTKMTKENVK